MSHQNSCTRLMRHRLHSSLESSILVTICADGAALPPTIIRFAGSENGWTNSRIALKRVVFLDGHSSHFSLELLRKARELNIKLIAYPAHCTHVLQGLDVVCFAKLKRELANEIHNLEHSPRSLLKQLGRLSASIPIIQTSSHSTNLHQARHQQHN